MNANKSFIDIMNYSDDALLEELKRRIKSTQNNEDNFKELMAELWKANKKLEESEAMKSHFISNITNEIINPFASIIGLSSNILNSKPEDWQKIKQMASLIYSEAFNLDFQLNNIFTAAKLEAGEISIDFINVDILEIIQNVIALFKNEADKKQITINLNYDNVERNNDDYFVTDPAKFRIIFSNLLSNAIQYSNATGKIDIKLDLKKSFINLSVKDYGVGIDKFNQKEIFDRFIKLNNNINTLNRGHGLGLSITKALLDLLEGKIDLISQKNHGSEFVIYIPEGKSNNIIDEFSSDGNDFIFDNTEKF